MLIEFCIDLKYVHVRSTELEDIQFNAEVIFQNVVHLSWCVFF